MSTLNKLSVREEVDRLKSEFARLRTENKVSEEVQVLFQSLLMVVDLILSIFLEKQTRKTSKNSGIPPSQMGQDETSQGTPGGHRKKRGFAEGEPLEPRRTLESVQILKVDHCGHCGEGLDQVKPVESERRTRIDIVFEKVVEHVDAEVKECPSCGMKTKAAFPKDLPGPLQYGLGLKAFIVNLLVVQMVALNRVQALVGALIGEVIAEVTLLKTVLRLHQALEAWEHESIRQLLAMPVMHVDETSVRIDKKLHWIHVYSSGDITLKFVHRRRGIEAMESLGLIPQYRGVMVHDCWKSYLSYGSCDHALCGAHLLRELTFIMESNQYAWARNMKRLLRETAKTVSERDSKCLTDDEYARLQKRYRTVLTRGVKELPEILERPKGKRGKLAKSDAHNLWERLKKHETAVLLFARKPEVAFTNNRAERDLRMSKVKQKVSGCFRTEVYAQAFCRISSYIQTMAYRGVNPIIAIQMAFAGKAVQAGGE